MGFRLKSYTINSGVILSEHTYCCQSCGPLVDESMIEGLHAFSASRAQDLFTFRSKDSNNRALGPTCYNMNGIFGVLGPVGSGLEGLGSPGSLQVYGVSL